MAERDVVFETVCLERRKEVKRQVWIMDYSPENIGALWEKSKEHRILFNDDINGDFNKFCNIFLYFDVNNKVQARGLNFIVDDFVGSLFVNNITKTDADLHFSFFDSFLRYHVSIKMLEFLFNEFEFDRLSAWIVPFASERVFEFILELGFRYEGKKRSAHTYKGNKFDLVLYGLLRKDLGKRPNFPYELRGGVCHIKRERSAEVQQSS